MKPLILATVILLVASFGLVMAFHPSGSAGAAEAGLQAAGSSPVQDPVATQSAALVPPVDVQSASLVATATPDASGNVTTIQFGFDGTGYSPRQIRVTQGTVVRLVANTDQITGCMTTITVGGYGVSKHVTAGDNIIQFTADKAGTYPITCPMGMGGGQLIVEDSSGNVPANVVAPTKSSGGCGCGG